MYSRLMSERATAIKNVKIGAKLSREKRKEKRESERVEE